MLKTDTGGCQYVYSRHSETVFAEFLPYLTERFVLLEEHLLKHSLALKPFCFLGMFLSRRHDFSKQEPSTTLRKLIVGIARLLRVVKSESKGWSRSA